jgi:hypothetical protein
VGWSKVGLNPGESAAEEIVIDSNDSSHPLSYWDTGSRSWLIAPGDYTVYVGNSFAPSSLQIAGTFHAGSYANLPFRTVAAASAAEG